MRAFCDTIFEIILEDGDWTRVLNTSSSCSTCSSIWTSISLFLFCDEKPRKESDRELFYIRLLILRL